MTVSPEGTNRGEGSAARRSDFQDGCEYLRHAPEFDALRFLRDEYWRLAAERRQERTRRESREALISIAPTQGYGWPERPRRVRLEAS